MSENLVSVRDLHVEFSTRQGIVKAVRGVSFDVAPGATLGIVGESGSGKSVTAYAITRLLDRAGKITSGQVRYFGQDLGSLTEPKMRRLRGSAISMIFQNPRAALNPIRSVGQQISDALGAHGGLTRAERRGRTLQLLRDVMLTDVERIAGAYPHTLSGGMCQRIMIALALACDPKLLIADEATTGLDVDDAEGRDGPAGRSGGPAPDGPRPHHARPGACRALLRRYRRDAGRSDRRERPGRHDLRKPQA